MKLLHFLLAWLLTSQIATGEPASNLQLTVELEGTKVRVVLQNSSKKAVEYYSGDTSSNRFSFPGLTTVRARRLGGLTFCYPNNNGSYWSPWTYWFSSTTDLPVKMKTLQGGSSVEATGDVYSALRFVPLEKRNYPLWEVTEVKIKATVALDPMLRNLITAETPWLPVKFDE